LGRCTLKLGSTFNEDEKGRRGEVVKRRKGEEVMESLIHIKKECNESNKNT